MWSNNVSLIIHGIINHLLTKAYQRPYSLPIMNHDESWMKVYVILDQCLITTTISIRCGIGGIA